MKGTFIGLLLLAALAGSGVGYHFGKLETQAKLKFELDKALISIDYHMDEAKKYHEKRFALIRDEVKARAEIASKLAEGEKGGKEVEAMLKNLEKTLKESEGDDGEI